ncbi:hypothetical protein BCR44DRAFT_1427931 [Catenaria anguillulae PL171]|uniref:Uncharacterized protein n=1 Tax=Catenaria anguillulae PL171 TaxID=765915 RepID=A0A1Y2HW67_9FUNG|nr:hypothetical protein BCR44DRAFT_1427931 [Catenaria anguillulae PL171]
MEPRTEPNPLCAHCSGFLLFYSSNITMLNDITARFRSVPANGPSSRSLQRQSRATRTIGLGSERTRTLDMIDALRWGQSEFVDSPYRIGASGLGSQVWASTRVAPLTLLSSRSAIDGVTLDSDVTVARDKSAKGESKEEDGHTNWRVEFDDAIGCYCWKRVKHK